MLVLFANKDIDLPNLRVRAGHPLPARFQQSTIFTLKSLREHIGADAIIPFTESTEGYVLVESARIKALEDEIAKLKEELGDAAPVRGRKARADAGGDKKETE